ncbi:hypothetical protein BJ508DRAFT_363377 [Ascobolus immersus RN42]|uniref:Uncharacterized protein n=1 Tax=Ascobolus immersus RN42 TaxID=1160509 RepID=A0A3N4I172_ASCIM|nr:hypothetical protein BJ508DRAFT_363377 [Ascobolus immersus RN42]
MSFHNEHILKKRQARKLLRGFQRASFAARIRQVTAQPALSTTFRLFPLCFRSEPSQQQTMARPLPAPRRAVSVFSSTKTRLAIAISILHLKPAHLTTPEFIAFLRQVLPPKSHLKDLKPVTFYRHLASFSSSTLFELRLKIRENGIDVTKQETSPEEPNDGKAQKSNKRKRGGLEKRKVEEVSSKKQRVEPVKAYKPMTTLKPYQPLLEGTPMLQKAVIHLKSRATPVTFVESLEVLTPFFTSGLPKLWIEQHEPHATENKDEKSKKAAAKQASRQPPKVPIGSVGVLYKAIDSLIKLVIQSLDGLSGLTLERQDEEAVCLSAVCFFWGVIGCIYDNSISIIYGQTHGNKGVLDIRNGLVEGLIAALSRLRPAISVQRIILEGLIAMLLDSASVFMFYPSTFSDTKDLKANDLTTARGLWEEAGRYFLRLLTIAISSMETRLLSRGRRSCQPWMLNARERLQERLSAAVLASVKQEDAISKRREMSLEDFSNDINSDYVDEVWALLGIEAIASLAPEAGEVG